LRLPDFVALKIAKGMRAEELKRLPHGRHSPRIVCDPQVSLIIQRSIGKLYRRYLV